MSAAPQTSSTPKVLRSLRGHVATIALDRPERMNTTGRAMPAELCEALLAAERDRNVRAIIITGTGRASFARLDLTDVDARAGLPEN